MTSGMMWFDNSMTLFSVKVQRAVSYYEKKYGFKPNLVLVHPSMYDSNCSLGDVTIRPYRPVLPGHLWVGREDEG